MCVGSVCTHPSYNDKTPPSVFKNPLSQILLFWDSCQNDVVLYWPLPGELIDKPSYLRPALSEVRPVRLRCREDKMSQVKQLRWFVVGCNNEYSSHHLLPTSEPLKTQRINVTFALKWMHPRSINASVYVSLTYRRSEYKGFYESLQIAFYNNVLVSQFRG